MFSKSARDALAVIFRAKDVLLQAGVNDFTALDASQKSRFWHMFLLEFNFTYVTSGNVTTADLVLSEHVDGIPKELVLQFSSNSMDSDNFSDMLFDFSIIGYPEINYFEDTVEQMNALISLIAGLGVPEGVNEEAVSEFTPQNWKDIFALLTHTVSQLRDHDETTIIGFAHEWQYTAENVLLNFSDFTHTVRDAFKTVAEAGISSDYTVGYNDITHFAVYHLLSQPEMVRNETKGVTLTMAVKTEDHTCAFLEIPNNLAYLYCTDLSKVQFVIEVGNRRGKRYFLFEQVAD